jgi:hypothetical protein
MNDPVLRLNGKSPRPLKSRHDPSITKGFERLSINKSEPIDTTNKSSVSDPRTGSKDTTNLDEVYTLESGECEYLDWKTFGGKAIRRGTHKDGSCKFHAILSSTSSTYRNADRKTQLQMCKDLRKSFADTLTMEKFLSLRVENGKVFDDPCYKRYINLPRDKISDFLTGKLGFSQKETNNLKFEAFKAHLQDTEQFTGSEVIQLIGDELDIDIYFMKNDEIVVQPVPTEFAYKKRPSVIILHVGRHHYEAIGVVRDSAYEKTKDSRTLSKGTLIADFFFPPDHPVIKILYEKQKKGWNEYSKLLY